MKKFFVFFGVCLSLTSLAFVSGGDKITSNLMNRILDLKLPIYGNECTVRVDSSGQVIGYTYNDCFDLTQGIGDGIKHPSTGNWEVLYSVGRYTVPPAVQVTVEDNLRIVGYGNASASKVDITIRQVNGTFINHAYSLTITAQGNDYKSIGDILLDKFPTIFN